jgi:DNA gyrase subunit A
VTSRGNGDVVGALIVDDQDRVIMITNKGQVIRIPVKNIRVTNRNTKGVTLMKVEGKEQIVAIAKVVEETEEIVETVEVTEETTSIHEESQQMNSDPNSLEEENTNMENKDQENEDHENKDPVVQE